MFALEPQPTDRYLIEARGIPDGPTMCHRLGSVIKGLESLGVGVGGGVGLWQHDHKETVLAGANWHG